MNKTNINIFKDKIHGVLSIMQLELNNEEIAITNINETSLEYIWHDLVDIQCRLEALMTRKESK